MRAVVVALALLVGLGGLGSTNAFAKDAVLVKLRDSDAKAAAKPASKKAPARTTKKKPTARKTVAKSKPKAKKKQKVESEETRLRPMP